MKKIFSIAPLAALILCGCPVPNKNTGLIEAIKVVQATTGSSSSSGSSTLCTYSPDTNELTFGAFNPLAGGYTHGLVIQNNLPNNSNLGPGRVNTNDFQVEYAIIGYGQIDGPAVVLPQQVVPGNGLIATATKGVTQLDLIPIAVAQAIGANSMKVRIFVQVYGVLMDGTRVHTNTYEYVVQADPTFAVAMPTCTAPQVAFACEGANQDTGTGCH